jgi:four helix bundle protein
VYRESASGPLRKDWSLRDQIRRSAISIASNIAEGSERGSNRDAVRFLFIARGSVAEFSTQCDIAHAVGLLDASTSARWLSECHEMMRILTRLIESRSPSQRDSCHLPPATCRPPFTPPTP